jgi:hypothetical protein
LSRIAPWKGKITINFLARIICFAPPPPPPLLLLLLLLLLLHSDTIWTRWSLKSGFSLHREKKVLEASAAYLDETSRNGRRRVATLTRTPEYSCNFVLAPAAAAAAASFSHASLLTRDRAPARPSSLTPSPWPTAHSHPEFVHPT